MNILFCSPAPLAKTYGVSKTLIELSEALENIGWNCKLVSPADVVLENESFRDYPRRLRQYLQEHAAEYDVVEYDTSCLPYPRKEFCDRTLFVTRSQMLLHHFNKIAIPLTIGTVSLKKNWKSQLRSLLLSPLYKIQLQQRIQQAHTTISEADLVILGNYDDKIALINCGIPEDKIAIIPNSISPNLKALFDEVSSETPAKPKVGFVGTFDNRKGCTDFPKIVERICQAIPDVSFRLLGTSGLYRTKEEVLAQFPTDLRSKLEIIPQFIPEDLPKLLADCSVGIFPSYLEAFPFGVLEMLSGSLPVIAYNSPGAPMMLPPEYLVPPGDTNAMSAKVVSLLSDRSKLAEARIWAKQQSQQFCWEQIARQTSKIYWESWQRKQVNYSP